MEVEITPEMQAKNLSNMSVDEIQKMMDNAHEEALTEVKEEDSTLTLGAIGSPYMVGPIDVTIAIGNLVLLNEIDSPFITGELGEEGDEIDATECIKSLYVLALGQKAIKPIMAIKKRVQGMMALKPMVEKNPDMFDKLLDRCERITEAHADFELKAMAWYNENFAGWDFQNVLDDMFSALNDVMKTSEDLPSSDSKKKV
jgi:hypothetical protein